VKATGVSYRRIATLVGMSQSQVAEIISGRQVLAYDVLVRIAEGLGVPRELMGLAYTDGPHAAYDGDEVPAPEVDEAVQRRRFLNATRGIVVPAVFHHVVPPSCLPDGPATARRPDAAAVQDRRQRRRGAAHPHRTDARTTAPARAETISAVAHHSTRLMGVTGDKHVKADLGAALAELHTLAGWSAFDSGAAPDAIRGHFSCALDFAMEAGDNYRASNAVYHAAMTRENDAPDESLNLLRIA